MSQIRLMSAAEQVAEHLREELVRGMRCGMMPGVLRLEAETGVNRKIIEAAMRQLEREGLLEPQGPGRRRKIAVVPGSMRHPLTVALLFGDATDLRSDYMVELRHSLIEAGHAVSHAPRLMADLGMKACRISSMVERVNADAWVVLAGSGEILEWFCGSGIPVFALFGRRRGLPVAGAGPDKVRAYAVATRRLIELGHRRIVLLAKPRRRLPEPGASERAFLAELAAHGIKPGAYHLPDWDENVGDIHARFEALFRITPPTAFIIQEVSLYVATLHFLARRGIRVPEDVSLVCTDASPDFAWCRPTVAHIRWDSRPVVRRVVQWAGNVSRGEPDTRQTLTKAVFVPGGTIAPVAVGS